MTRLYFQLWQNRESFNGLFGVDRSIERQYLVGDRAYTSQQIRSSLGRSGTTPVIPKRSHQKQQGRFNRGLYP